MAGDTIASLLEKGEFSQVIEQVKRIESLEEQAVDIIAGVIAYAVQKGGQDAVCITEDLAEYNSFLEQRQKARCERYVVYVDPQTEEIAGGIGELLEDVVGAAHPLTVYYKQLAQVLQDMPAKYSL